MSDKKKRILEVALELFANDGFNATSTSKIANAAEVSEGLIFRHFENKKGLLQALTAQATSKVLDLINPILMEENPDKVVQMTIELPFIVPDKDYDFWKLQFKLKWENDYDGKSKMTPLIDKLNWAFSVLEYEEPQKEAEVLNHIIESISTGILREGKKSQATLKEFLLKKYLT